VGSNPAEFISFILVYYDIKSSLFLIIVGQKAHHVYDEYPKRKKG
jgi:hypothetical protein